MRFVFKDSKRIDFFYNFWFGLFLLIIILEFVSLIYPLNGKVLICLIVFDFLLFALNLKKYKKDWEIHIKEFFRNLDYKKVLLFAVLALFISFLANLPTTWYDTYLYHLNSVRWLTDYGTVRGLANLHSRLGVNNVTFILAAIMGHGVFTNASTHVVNSLLFVVFAFQIITFLFSKNKNNLIRIFGLFSLLVMSMFVGQINSLSTDFGLTIFVLVSAFYTLLLDKENLILAVPLFAMAATTKYSYFVGLILFFLFVIIELKSILLSSKKNIIFLLFTLAFFLGFILRNLILSGWPFFPLPILGVHFQWQVPIEIARNFNDVVKAWARLPGPKYLSSLNVGFWGWFINWFNNNKPNLYYLFSVIPLTFAYFFSRYKFKENQNVINNIKKIDFLIFMNLASLLYTFITAPDFRFMGIYIYVVISLILPPFLTDFLKYAHFKNLIVLLFIFTISGYLLNAVDLKKEPELFTVQKEESTLVKPFIINYPDQSFYVWTPVNGDRCGNSQLPCTPYLSGFKMIQYGNIKAGFYPTNEITK